MVSEWKAPKEPDRDGGPATSMTVLDVFAAQAFAGLMSNAHNDLEPGDNAILAYRYAHALIKERARFIRDELK